MPAAEQTARSVLRMLPISFTRFFARFFVVCVMAPSSFTGFHRRRRRRMRQRKNDGRSACAILVVMVCVTDILLLLMALYFADDGSSRSTDLMSGREKPAGIECSRIEQRLKTAETLRPQFDVPLERGPGVIVLGLASPPAANFAAIARHAASTEDKRPISCCRGEEWNFDLRVHRQTVYHSAGWPLDSWTDPTAYHPFLFAAVPSAKSRAILVVQDPVERLRRIWQHSHESLVRFCNHSTVGRGKGVLETASAQLVARDSRCFPFIFHQRLLALSRGEWLPFVVERFEESLLLISRAYGWTRVLPPRPQQTMTLPPVSVEDRQIIARAQPNDQKLYDLANNALSAWQAKLGKEFSSHLRAMRETNRLWKILCNATNHSVVESTATPKKPSEGEIDDVCGWLLRAPPATSEKRPVERNSTASWARQPCVFDPIWSTWCTIAT